MVLKLIRKEHEIDNVWSFCFEPSEPCTWTAGQFVRVELPHDQPDDEGTKRWFTVSSAPYENIIQITTRITETTFKKALDALQEGDEIQLVDSPDGDFVWQDAVRPIVFVAGGIGITPFYSILKQRFHDGLPADVTLVYGSRTDDVPFKKDLDAWATANPNFTVHYVVGTPLSAESLQTIAPDINASLVYVSGPEPMVESLGDGLKAAGLAEAQLRQDFFPNYNDTNY